MRGKKAKLLRKLAMYSPSERSYYEQDHFHFVHFKDADGKIINNVPAYTARLVAGPRRAYKQLKKASKAKELSNG